MVKLSEVTWEGRKSIMKAVEGEYGGLPQMIEQVAGGAAYMPIDICEACFLHGIDGYSQPEDLAKVSYLDLQNGAVQVLSALFELETEKKKSPSIVGAVPSAIASIPGDVEHWPHRFNLGTKTVEVTDKADFWGWFFREYADKDSFVMFKDFTLIGRWAWLQDWPEIGFFNELIERYTAAKELGIQSAVPFERMPVRMLNGLLTIGAELTAAQQWKAKEDARKE